MDSYKSIIPIGKFPVTVLKINCSPLVIDVNVHPSKAEIRFTDEFMLKQLITSTIMNVLEQTDLIYQNVLTKNRILMAYEAGVKNDTRAAHKYYMQLKNNLKIYPIKGEADLEHALADYVYERFCSNNSHRR